MLDEMGKTISLSDLAYEAIKRDIIRGVLAPEQAVTEAELGDMHRLGRTPVREALGRLARERLIRVLPRRGYLVAPINLHDVLNLYAVRLLLEAEAARLGAGHVDAEQLQRLDATCRAGYDPADPESVHAFLAVNSEFHVTVARASGNDRLVDMIAPLLDEMERLMFAGLRRRDRTLEMAHEHRDLVDALIEGDGEGAARIVTAQIHASQKMALSALLHDRPQAYAAMARALP